MQRFDRLVVERFLSETVAHFGAGEAHAGIADKQADEIWLKPAGRPNRQERSQISRGSLGIASFSGFTGRHRKRLRQVPQSGKRWYRRLKRIGRLDRPHKPLMVIGLVQMLGSSAFTKTRERLAGECLVLMLRKRVIE